MRSGSASSAAREMSVWQEQQARRGRAGAQSRGRVELLVASVRLREGS
jgi:hypothetical protein